MTFVEWLTKYWGKGASIAQQALETGLPVSQIETWAKWVQDRAGAAFLETGTFLTLDQLIELWKKEHPPTITRMTPFGPVEVVIPDGKTADQVRMVSELTVDELEALICRCVKG